MSKINTIIFDLGGVLIDWNPRYLYRQIFEDESQVDWFLDNICTMEWNEEQDAGRSWQEATAMKVLEHPEHAEPIKAYYSRWTEMLNGPIQKNVNLLKTLKQSSDYRLYALTNWSAETFPTALEMFDFLSLFEGIVVSGMEKTRKPFPEIYNIILDRYDINPNQTLFLDDNIKNCKMGHELGIEYIHVQKDLDLKEEFKKRSLV